MRGIPWLAEWLLASHEELLLMELVTYWLNYPEKSLRIPSPPNVNHTKISLYLRSVKCVVMALHDKCSTKAGVGMKWEHREGRTRSRQFICKFLLHFRIMYGVVGIVTRLRTAWSGIQIPQGPKAFLFFKRSRPRLLATGVVGKVARTWIWPPTSN